MNGGVILRGREWRDEELENQIYRLAMLDGFINNVMDNIDARDPMANLRLWPVDQIDREAIHTQD